MSLNIRSFASIDEDNIAATSEGLPKVKGFNATLIKVIIKVFTLAVGFMQIFCQRPAKCHDILI